MAVIRIAIQKIALELGAIQHKISYAKLSGFILVAYTKRVVQFNYAFNL